VDYARKRLHQRAFGKTKITDREHAPFLDHRVFGESTRPINPWNDHVPAIVVVTTKTFRAVIARHVGLDGDPVANLDSCALHTDFNHVAAEFMPWDQRISARKAPLKDMDIRTANSTGSYLDQNFIRPRSRISNLLDLHFVRASNNERFHRVLSFQKIKF